MKNGVFSERISENRRRAFLLFAAIVPLLLMIAGLFDGILGKLGTPAAAIVISVFLLVLVLVLRQYELAVALIVVAHLYIDWFLGREIVGTTVAIGLLFLLFIVRSPQYPWVASRILWLWCLFLVLAIFPAIRGAQSRNDLAFYYPNIFFGALVMFWLGLLIARDKMHLRTLFQMLALLGTILAIHTIIQSRTGIVVFSSTNFNTYLTQLSNFTLANSDVSRAGSFFENPDWNGAFFAIMLFVPLGLLAESTSYIQKFLYFIEILLLAIALLFTYSIGAWIGALAGIIAFILFAGRKHYRLLVPMLMVIIGLILMIIFPTEINAQFQHLSNPTELSLRSGAWQTAIQIIKAFPLTGIGLGLTNYLQRSELYRVPTQYEPLAHPHNSYLELGAMAGLPVLIVFLTLLLCALWQAWRNWTQVDKGTRCLLGGGIASIVALSVNSLGINGWTLPPLAAIGWLVLGAVASPLVRRTQPDMTANDIQQ